MIDPRLGLSMERALIVLDVHTARFLVMEHRYFSLDVYTANSCKIMYLRK